MTVLLLVAALMFSACGDIKTDAPLAATGPAITGLPEATEYSSPEPACNPEPSPGPTPSQTPRPTPSPSPTPIPDYSFELFGQEVSTADERIEFINVPIGDEGVAVLREALPQLRACKYLLLDNCKISNEQMAKMRDDFPQMKIVWRVNIASLSFLTDVTVIHLANEIGPKFISNGNSSVLGYCTDMEYLDLGHNVLNNIDFCANMPHLKYLIMSYNYNLTDLTPLENCPELEMAEFYFCISLSDLSPLTACKNLKYLNVSATAVRDITPVYKLKKLERFFCIMNYLDPLSQQQDILTALPGCWSTFEKPDSINVGWSYNAPKVRAAWYLKIYDIWRYNTEDWYFGYLPETEQTKEAVSKCNLRIEAASFFNIVGNYQ